jgi:Uma2 family endonuclease
MIVAAELLKLLDRLGDIDPARVRLQPLPGTATEDDLLHTDAEPERRPYELVDGTLVEKVTGFDLAIITGNCISALHAFVRPLRIGVVLGPRAPYRLAAGLVRSPSASFITASKWRQYRITRPPIAPFAPDIAADYFTPANTRAEMARKRREYFTAGARLVWEVNPRRRTVTVYTTPTASTRLTEVDTLSGGDVLPGFALPLAELFADPLGDD